MPGAQWERVKPNKKQKSNKTTKSLDTEKSSTQNVEATPLKLESMFEAFDGKSKANNHQKQPFQDRSNLQPSPKANKKPRKPKKQPPTFNFKHDAFEDAVLEVSTVGLDERAKEIRNRDKVWQKEIANYLNEAISCPEESPAFLDQDFGYPLTATPKSLRDALHKYFIKETTESFRKLLFDHFLRTLKEYSAKDRPTWGYRLCVQTLAHFDPETCLDDLQKQYEDIVTTKNAPKRCLTIMWTLGQVGFNDVKSGMKVWLEVMMPLLNVKSLAGYSVHYLESIIKMVQNPKDLSGTINPDLFVEILKWTYDSTTGLSQSLRDRLVAMFGVIRTIATFDPQLKQLVFAKFLRTPVSEISLVKSPFLDATFQCMSENPKCMNTWREEYLSSLPQTKLLLEYIDGKWDQLAKKLPRNFGDVIRYFHSVNIDAAAESSSMTSVPEFKTVKALCSKFLGKLERRTRRKESSCVWMFLSVFVAVVGIGLGLFFYDANLHGGVHKSMTYKYLESTGTLKVLEQVWERIFMVLQQINIWLQKNAPHFMKRTGEILGPYLTYIWLNIQNFSIWVVNMMRPIGEIIVTYTYAALLWADGVFHRIYPYIQDMFASVWPYFVACYNWIAAKASSVVALAKGEIGWCCFRDAIGEDVVYLYGRFSAFCAYIWTYCVYLFKIASDYVSGENM